MALLEDVPWPPDPVRTERCVLRPVEARDRAAFIELYASPEVRRYLGGPLDREMLEREVEEVPGQQAGQLAVEVDGECAGIVTIDRREPERPGHVRPEGLEPELSYTLLPWAWGRGIATEAAGAMLAWSAEHLADEVIVLCTQTANEASMGVAAALRFTEVERFIEFDAEQWLGSRPLR